MDILFDNDLDNNNNVIEILNNIELTEDNQDIELNREDINIFVNNMRANITNEVSTNMDDDDIASEVNILNTVNKLGDELQSEPIPERKNAKGLTRLDVKDQNTTGNTQLVMSNANLCVRKSKKRKRHHNVNKNKKWNKVFKRQKLGNSTKSDTESVLQNSRNKHVYTKVPKIIFSNKQVMHRGSGLSKFFLPDKRPRDIIVPPTKFLLGGNISDPLNLNSLQDEALVSISAITPKSSPIPTPPKVEVIIPPNIYDPLHLLDPVDSIEYEKQLVSPIKNRRLNRQRSRKKKIKKSDTDENSGVVSSETVSLELAQTIASPNSILTGHEPFEKSEKQDMVHIEDIVSVDEKLGMNRDFSDQSVGSCRKRKSSESGIQNNSNGAKKIRRFDSKDKIVSPVIPQPGAWKRPPKVQLGAPRNRIRTTSASGMGIIKLAYQL